MSIITSYYSFPNIHKHVQHVSVQHVKQHMKIRAFESMKLTCSDLAAGCCQGTGGFLGTLSHSGSDRMTESADNQRNPPGSDLTAAG